MHKGFRGLEVWQEAKDLAVYIYKQTDTGNICKDFGLRDQLIIAFEVGYLEREILNEIDVKASGLTIMKSTHLP